MKTKLITLFTIINCQVSILNCFSQTTVIVGTSTGANPTTSYPCPLSDYYVAHRAQYLYNAAAMSGAGITAGSLISELGWVTNASTISAHLQEGYSISLSNTTITDVNATSWETGLTTVYGPTNYSYVSGSSGNVVFTLTTPFIYTGGGLLVEVCSGVNTGTYSSNPQCQWQTAVGYNASHTYRADAVNGCGNASVVNSGTLTTRPLLVVGFAGGSGIGELGIRNYELQIAPNPASQLLVVSCLLWVDEVKIYNVLGECVFKSKDLSQKSKVEVDVSTLPSGVYFVEGRGAKDGGRVARTKFIKQ